MGMFFAVDFKSFHIVMLSDNIAISKNWYKYIIVTKRSSKYFIELIEHALSHEPATTNTFKHYGILYSLCIR